VPLLTKGDIRRQNLVERVCCLVAERAGFDPASLGLTFETESPFLVQFWCSWDRDYGWTKIAQFCRVNGRIGRHLHRKTVFFTSLGSRFKSSARSKYRGRCPIKAQICHIWAFIFLFSQGTGADRVDRIDALD